MPRCLAPVHIRRAAVAKAMTARAITVTDLARRASRSTTWASRILSDVDQRRPVTPRRARQLALALGLELDAITE